MKPFLLLFSLFALHSVYGQRLAAPILGNYDNSFDYNTIFMDASADGKRVAKGIYFSNFNGNRSGHVDVHELLNNQWVRVGQRLTGEGIDSDMCTSLSMSGDGNNILICSGIDNMSCQAYFLDNNTWVKRGEELDQQNAIISKGGNHILAAKENILSVYSFNNGEWTKVGNSFFDPEIISTQPLFDGLISLAISDDGSFIAAAHNGYKTQANVQRGGAKVYRLQGGVWTTIGGTFATTDKWNYGWSIDLSADGHSVAMKRRSNEDGTPNILVYELNNDEWVQKGQIVIAGEHSADVDLSADGTYFGVTETIHDRSHIYKFNNGIWQKAGLPLYRLKEARTIPGEQIFITNDKKVISANVLGSNSEIQVFVLDDIFGRVYHDLDGNCQYETASWNPDTVLLTEVIIQPGEIIVPTNENGYWYLETLDDGDYSLTVEDSSFLFSCDTIMNFRITNNELGVECLDWAFSEITPDKFKTTLFEDKNENCLFDIDEEIYKNVKCILTPGEISVTSSYWGEIKLENLPYGDYTLTINDDKYETICDTSIHFSISNNGQNIDSLNLGLKNRNIVTGEVYIDKNNNCLKNNFDLPSYGTIVKITPGDIFASTDQDGKWTVENLFSGQYSAEAIVNDSISLVCSQSDFTMTSYTTEKVTGSIGVKPNPICNFTNLKVSSNNLRPCFEFQRFKIAAKNSDYSYGSLVSPYVIAEMDSLLTIDSCSHDYTINELGQVIIPISNLEPGEEEKIFFYVTVDCDAENGTTICSNFILLPIDSCALLNFDKPQESVAHVITDYDGSNINLSKVCNEDSIRFSITNEGLDLDSDMNFFAPLFLYRDDQLINVDSIKLNAQEVSTISIFADRATYRLESEQHPLHPGKDRPVAIMENCGSQGIWTSGLVNNRYYNNLDQHVDFYCRELTNSFDPNDKMGIPLGNGPDNYILPNEPINYTIRFQNTGNDTAFNVFIIDTIDNKALDITSFLIGDASHDMTYEIYGTGIIRFDFKDILLVDSLTNEPGSHGYVNFTINQIQNLPDFEEINNSAGIYFDFNEPIITNISKHTVMRNNYIISGTKDINGGDIIKQFFLYPNPTEGLINFETKLNNISDWDYSLYDQLGRTVMVGKLKNHESHFLLPKETGFYLLKLTNKNQQYELHKIIKN